MTSINIDGTDVRVTKVAIRSYLKVQLGVNPAWAKKALIEIFNNQTDDEVRCETTSDLNGIGFSGTDAEILTSFAKQLMRRGSLSPKQMTIVFKKMPKYWKQIMGISNEDKLNLLVATQITSVA